MKNEQQTARKTASENPYQQSPDDLALYVGAFFDELQRAGVRDVVISPGSRSTPLAMVAYASSLNCYLDVDERGAAFFALGRAKATARPACVICTSGTALANYYPAVMEAESSRVPLIVLSGDRPQHLQQLSAPQTCDQLKAFSNHVKAFWQMPDPVASPKRISYVRQIAREAYARCGAGTIQGGAVHLNFPFDEPLKPNLEVADLFELGRQGCQEYQGYQARQSFALPGVMDARSAENAGVYLKQQSPALPCVVDVPATLDGTCAENLANFLKSHNVIAVCGEGTLGVGISKFVENETGYGVGNEVDNKTGNEAGEVGEFGEAGQDCTIKQEVRDAKTEERAKLQAFSEEFDIPLLVDPLSQLRTETYEGIIDNYDNFIADDACPDFDVVIRFGRWPVSKRLTTTIQNSSIIQIVVDPFETRDFTSSTSMLIKMDPADFVSSMVVVSSSVAKELATENNIEAQSATEEENTAQHPEAGENGVSDVADQRTADQHPEAGETPNPYLKKWATINKQERSRILQVQQVADNSFEGSYVQALVDELPEDSLLFSANSMAIRALDTFYVKQPKNISVLANRGLNGIDGTLSTAFGAAQSFEQSVCLTGDLTMLHDLNSLAMQHEMKLREALGYKRPSITIVLMNNAGGAIFDMLPQKYNNPYFERLFLTPQNINFKAAAETFSVPYWCVDRIDGFKKAFGETLGDPGIHLIEIKLPLQGVKERYAPFQ